MEKIIDDHDFLFKIITIGPSSVGKTSIITRFCSENFSENYISTLGVDFKIKTININEKRVKMQIWDTAGQERYQGLTRNYYEGAHACICVFDVTSEESFISAQNFVSKCNSYFNVPGECFVIVANKIDLEEKRQVSSTEGEGFAKSYEAYYLETSAKLNENIDDLFYDLCERIIQTQSIFFESFIGSREEKKSLKLEQGLKLKGSEKSSCC